MWPVPDRWDPSQSLRCTSRVELRSKGQVLSSNVPITAGKMTEKRVSGIRAHLELSLEPSPQMYQWMRLPALEFRPFAGFDWGASSFEVPLGQFPLLPPPLALPRTAIAISVDDYWSRMVQFKLGYAILSYPDNPWYRVSDAADRLIYDVGLGNTANSATNNLVMGTTTIWDKDKTASDIVLELMDSIGAEAFVDRFGQVQIQDRQTYPGRPLKSGPGGTIVSFTTTQDWTDVYNEIAVYSSNNQSPIFPGIATITDPLHPAYQWNGLGRKPFTFSSPLFTTTAQAQSAAPALLDKKSTAALGWTLTALSDPSVMAADAVAVTTSLGVVNAVVQEVVHDLTGGLMSLTLGAA